MNRFCPNCQNLMDCTKNIKVQNDLTNSDGKAMVGEQTGGGEVTEGKNKQQSTSGKKKTTAGSTLRKKKKKELDTLKVTEGTDIDKIIRKLAKGKDVAIPFNITLGQIETTKSYQKLDEDKKKKVIDKIKGKAHRYQRIIIKESELTREENDEGTNQSYFICNSCKYFTSIKPGTVISSFIYNSKKESSTAFDYENMKNYLTLPHSKVHKCKNKNCPTHQDIKLRDVVDFRVGKGYEISHMCMVCNTYW